MTGTLKTLNQSQIMLLQSFAVLDTQEDSDELMDVLKAFYAKKLDEEMSRLWDDGTLDQTALDKLRGEHLRVLPMDKLIVLDTNCLLQAFSL